MLPLLWMSTAFAGQMTVLPMPPVVADGETAVTLQVQVPGLLQGDKIKVTPGSGVVHSYAVPQPGLLVMDYTPAPVSSSREAKIRVRTKGAVKLDEELRVPVEPPSRAELDLSFEPAQWDAGTKGTVTVTVTASGDSPIPVQARDVLLTSVGGGTLSAVTEAADGTWTATWTPPAKLTDPTHVVFVATDLTSPDEVWAAGALPVRVNKSQQIEAGAGSQNVVVIGEDPYGPIAAGADGTFSIDAMLDPRVVTATLQSVDATGYRTDSTVELDLGTSPALAIAPVPKKVPARADMTAGLWVINGDGTPWSGAAPECNGTPAASQGSGWYTCALTAPAELGAWTVDITVPDTELAESRSFTVIDAVPSLALSSDIEALKDKQRDFAVTALLKSADGTALTGRKLDWSPEGASPLGKPVDNGDGTYTQRYRISSKASVAAIQVQPNAVASGLPVHSLVMWSDADTLPADGSTKVTVRVVALDARGLPVPKATIALSVPFGEAAIAPEATTDAHGMATVELRAGTEAGVLAIQSSARGITTTTLVVQHDPEATGVSGMETGGTAASRDAVAFWKSASPTLVVPKVGSDVGPPAALTLTTVPGYTTPGAAILITIAVTDADGNPVVGVKPTLKASVGKLGTIQNNGDGTYNVPLQLPAGVDGPVTLTGQAGPAAGATTLPTFASMGEQVPQTVTDGGNSGSNSGSGSDEPKPPRTPGQANNWHVRLLPTAVYYNHTATRVEEGDGRIPTELSFQRGALKPIPAVSFQVDGHPTGGVVGFDVRLRYGSYKLAIGALEFQDTVFPTMAAVRFRGQMADGMFAYGTAGVQVVDVPIFRYSDALDDVEYQSKVLVGGRLGGGLQIGVDPIDVRLEIAETFAPFPVMTHVDVMVDIKPTPDVPVILSMGYDQDFHHVSMLIGSDDPDTVQIRARQGALMVGLGGAF
jgi:hypothetical protein